MSSKDSIEYFMVIGEENHAAFAERVENLLIKLKGKSNTRLLIVALGKSIETTIQRLREALLCNISVSVRLYLARSLDEFKTLISNILSEASPGSSIVFLCVDEALANNIISILNTHGVARVESC